MSFPTPFIIADVGSNWRRYDSPTENLNCAIEHIREAASCGVSAVKFQLFTHEELYGIPGDDTYALPREWVPVLAKAAAEFGVEFMCTAFSADGVRFVDPYVERHKIASAELMHWGIFDAAIDTGKPVIASMGGQDVHDVNIAVNRALDKSAQIALLECVASYPAEASDYNLGAMQDYAMHFGISAIGVSDHTLGTTVALVAVALGAAIFEKHFIADLPACGWGPVPAFETPDMGHSLEPKLMRKYVAAINEGFSALGDGIKKPRESEADFVRYARREAGENTFRRKKP